MIVVNSREQTIASDVPPYVSSEPEDSEWGQPPASRYIFMIEGTRLRGEPIVGVYLRSPRSSESPPVDPRLVAELDAWKAARDEALTNFEATLD